MAPLPPKLDIQALPPAVDVSDNATELARVQSIIDSGPYDATWESLSGYEPPLWYQDAKFGVFIHWGVFSVPAFGSEWYSREMYREGTREYKHHIATYGPQSTFGYKDFIPSFTMENFQPEEWAELFRRSGAQFIVPVAEHHDGFAMYQTDRSRWNAAAMGPTRDVLGDLLTACDEAWMVRGASSHRAEHWFFMNGGTRFDSDVWDPRTVDFYGPAQREETAPNERFLEDWLLRTVEIIDRYRPQVLWFDWWIEQPAFERVRRQLAAYYYNRAAQWGRGVVINYKWDAFAEGSAVYDIERGVMGGTRAKVWQNDTAVSKSSWGWTEGHEYKTPRDIIAELADVVSKNGNLLLNIGPRPDGTIADEEREILIDVGRWLSINGEAIYGTRPWLIPAEGPTKVRAGSFVDDGIPQYTGTDFRFTTRRDVTGDYVYAISLRHPDSNRLKIRAFGYGSGLLTREITAVDILGHGRQESWTQEDGYLGVDVPPTGDPLGMTVIKLWLAPQANEPRQDFLHQ